MTPSTAKYQRDPRKPRRLTMIINAVPRVATTIADTRIVELGRSAPDGLFPATTVMASASIHSQPKTRIMRTTHVRVAATGGAGEALAPVVLSALATVPLDMKVPSRVVPSLCYVNDVAGHRILKQRSALAGAKRVRSMSSTAPKGLEPRGAMRRLIRTRFETTSFAAHQGVPL